MSKPSELRVSGARKVLEELEEIETAPINLNGVTKSFQRSVKLNVKGLEVVGVHEQENSAPVVDVSVGIVEELEAKQLAARRVVIRSRDATATDLARFRLEPPEVVVTLNGSLQALEAVDESKVNVFAELSDLENLRMPHPVVLRVEPMLPDIAYKVSPMVVTLQPADG